jgi:hypothetical protein
MPGKLKVTGSIRTPRDPIEVKAYCEGRQFAKDGGSIVFATGVTGVVANNNAIKWTAKIPGNGYEVNLVNPGPDHAAISISISTNKLYVGLATDDQGDVISTATEVIAAVAANTGAAAVVGAANEGASTGAGVPVVQGVSLTGSNFNQIVSEVGVVFAAGVASWTADPTGVGRDACSLPYGGGHV